jgi:hypothetical protein
MKAGQVMEAGVTAGWLTLFSEAILFIEALINVKVCIS